MSHLITVFYKAKKTTGSDGFESFAICQDPADWLIDALSTNSEVDQYYEKPRIVFCTPLTENQYQDLKDKL